MREMRERLGRWTASAGMLAVLGFGATQALASPPEARQGPTCNTGQCNVSCKAMGYDGGRCTSEGCSCFIIVDPLSTPTR